MSSRRVELALARERLRVRSSVLRGEVVQQSRALTPLLSAADKGRVAVYRARTHPAFCLALGHAVLVLVADHAALARHAGRDFAGLTGAVARQTTSPLRARSL